VPSPSAAAAAAAAVRTTTKKTKNLAFTTTTINNNKTTPNKRNNAASSSIVNTAATITTATTATSRGGGGGGAAAAISGNNKNKVNKNKVNNTNKPPVPVPSIYWAVLHNWFYFLSLGFNAINIPYLIREVVDGSDAIKIIGYKPSSNAIALSGNVEAIDKVCTFCGIAFLSALSDKYGRKSLIAWSSFGFAITNLLQALVASNFLSGQSIGIRTSALYFADFIDGCSSCMTPVCQAYVADCSYGSGNLASNLGIFQGYVRDWIE